MPLEPLDWTFVVYDSADQFGPFLASATLTPFFVFVSQVTLVFARRELWTLHFTAGQLIVAVLAVILKKILKMPRPEHDWPMHWKKEGYGMPSEHATFIAYFCVMIVLFLQVRVKWLHSGLRLLYSFATIAWSLVVCYSRYHFQVHTVAQIVVGVLFGAFFALLWFAVGPVVIRFFESTRLAQYFYLKDSSPISNVIRFEYQTQMEERAKKKAKE